MVEPLSVTDPPGPLKWSLIQRLSNYTAMYYCGTGTSVLNREGFLHLEGPLIENFHCSALNAVATGNHLAKCVEAVLYWSRLCGCSADWPRSLARSQFNVHTHTSSLEREIVCVLYLDMASCVDEISPPGWLSEGVDLPQEGPMLPCFTPCPCHGQ